MANLAVIIMGSVVDKGHAEKISSELKKLGIEEQMHVASAHKQPREVLEIIDSYKGKNRVVFITIAGRSNALSGFVAANTNFPTLACPPFVDKLDMLVNIHSTLQLPSNVPVLTVLEPANAALAVKRIFDLTRGAEEV
ncbi:MAG: AIR carboxylase family protein [Sphaerochaetaceae bacterium]